MKFSTTYITHKCPKCNNVVKNSSFSTGNGDGLLILALIILFPIGLIVLIVKLIQSAKQEELGQTALGEDIVICKHCGTRLAVSQYYTRILLSANDILDIIKPSLMALVEYCIYYNQITTNEKLLQDTLVLQFVNAINKKSCIVYISSSTELQIHLNSQKYDYSHEKLVALVSDELD